MPTRRPRRRLLNILTLFSLLCYLTTVALLIRSRSSSDLLAHRQGDGLHQLLLADGRLYFQSIRHVERTEPWRVRGATRPANPTDPPPGGFTLNALEYGPRVTGIPGPKKSGWRWTSGTSVRDALFPSRPLFAAPPQYPPPTPLWPGAQDVTHVQSAAQYTSDSNIYGTFKSETKSTAHLLTGRTFWLPLWIPATASALLPALRLTRLWTRHRRAQRNLCPHCAYDLRATPERCPECGTVPT